MPEYKVKSCHTTKTAARRKQKAMHKKGLTAKIVTKGTGKKKRYCVESKGKSKAPAQLRKKVGTKKRKRRA